MIEKTGFRGRRFFKRTLKVKNLPKFHPNFRSAPKKPFFSFGILSDKISVNLHKQCFLFFCQKQPLSEFFRNF
nr:MAG TPA_asm: hypothetical protein [Caudoviricetes sp.]